MTSKPKNHIIRDDKWLRSRLDDIWTKYFSDVPQTNEQSSSANKLFIRFGRFAKLRLGSIKYNKQTKDTVITITSMFKNSSAPKDVIDHTIAHELIHYSHGFSSPHAKLHKYPHAGGIIKKEMLIRGMRKQFCAYKDWIKTYRKSLQIVGTSKYG